MIAPTDDRPIHLGGRYRCLERLGQGAAATVWSAEDVVLGRSVAIKLLKAEFGEGSPDAMRKRFEREARILGAIEHPHVVKVHDFGIGPEGLPFLVMEHLVGRSLGEVVEAGPVSVVDAVVTICALLGGLAVVHDAGIVHADLKPENIFLASDADGGEHPVLLDFGISRATDASAGLRSVMTTVNGRIRGTPHYMSPEQTRGWKTDHRSDLYSVGTVLFELLTGRLPFDTARPVDVMIDIATKRPPKLTSLRPELPTALAEVVERALSIECDERYPDARSLRSAIVMATRHLPGVAAGLARALVPSDSALLDLGTGAISSSGPPKLPPPPPISDDADRAFGHRDAPTMSEPALATRSRERSEASRRSALIVIAMATTIFVAMAVIAISVVG